MVATNIKVFFRVRPSARPSKALSIKQDEGLIEFSQEKATPDTRRQEVNTCEHRERQVETGRVRNREKLVRWSKDGEVNNTKTHYKFRFDGILPMKISQEEVFNLVARPVIEDVMQGINGTIFAYGQTGSGKTFTITGGPPVDEEGVQI
eukprot:g15838.t1